MAMLSYFYLASAWKCIASNANASFSVSVKKRVSSFQVAAKSIFDIAAPALVGRVHTLHHPYMARSIRMFTDQGRLFVPFWRPGRSPLFRLNPVQN